MRGFTLVLPFLTLVAGCPSEHCTTGVSVACTCPDGRMGAQVCLADGTLGACACDLDAGLDAPAPLDVPSDTATSPDTATPSDVPIDVPAEADTGHDAPALRDAPVRDTSADAGPAPCVRDIDLLFEIDTSNSMMEEQALLRAELPRLVRVLATGDGELDGTADFAPAQSLHLGVITPDMGGGNVPPGEVVPSCPVGLGDDGIMQRRVRAPDLGCPASYPSNVFSFAAGDDPAVVASDLACVANVGTGGCGFEQQLEAALKALSPASATTWVRSDYAPPTFALDRVGHGDGMNDGFLRDGSLLAIVLVTDEDDCSVPDYALFLPSEPRYLGVPLNLRCSMLPTELHGVDRYRDGFLQLRDDPRQLVFSAIAGIPTDAAFGDTVAGYDTLLTDARMENVVDPDGIRLLPVCSEPATGTAYPARRLVEAARALNDAGAHTRVSSICAPSYAPSIDGIVEAIVEGAPSCM